MRFAELKAPAEKSWMFPLSSDSVFLFVCLFVSELTFAISKQRLTLAGQEIAALGNLYHRGL